MNNPSELAGLPEDVREAVVAIDTGNGVFVDRDDGIGGEKWHTVRAELLRMADENAELRKHGQTMFLDARDWATRFGEQEARAEHAEAELAALKRRIAEAPIGTVHVCYNGHEPAFIGFDKPFERGTADDVIEKRVALLPVGGDRER